MENIKFKAQYMALSPRLRKKTDPRRIQELMDARMIQEDENAMANCPTRFINQEFHHSYINPYDDNVAIRPIPERNRRFSDNEDMYSREADRETESYGGTW